MIAFDDGPDASTTPRILDILKERHTRATFFVVGDRIAGQERLLGRILVEGHTLGNHGWSHRPLVELNPVEIATEIAMTDALILGLTGVWPKDFRPPFVRWDDGNVVRIAEAMGHVCHLQPSFGDYDLSTTEIVEATRRLPVGSPVWLHDGVEATVEALPTICRSRALTWV
ncbi:MAG TPA: polysaccharide deacetylase family protein [Gaiellaceae bacterium]|jgi:peptidoglycan/xylan/chitin deacetylase (PgdA/CDA1 family)|nr:polysaccharide deacetylase family protein [Gaiellaceae bacterium]